MSLHKPETLKRYQHYRKKSELVIVKFGAEWCGPCRKIIPTMEKLAREYPQVYFLDVDIDNEEFDTHPDLKNVRGIPHFKFFLDGVLVKEFTKSDREKLKKYTKKYYKRWLKSLPTNTSSDNSYDNNDNNNDGGSDNKDRGSDKTGSMRKTKVGDFN